MNIATLIGLIFGISLLILAIIFATGEPWIFFEPIGFSIVIGGVIAATFICYPINKIFRVFKSFIAVFKREDLPMTNYIRELYYLSGQSISGGSYKLEKELDGVENYFLKNGLRMLVDNYPRESIREIMETMIENTRHREYREAAVFRSMAKFSPAFGMIGTLIGLIVMFQNLNSDDLSGIGPAMSIAMMTTFYGILFANLFFLPIATKLEDRIEERTLLMTVIMEGVILLSKKTPPPILLEQLKVYLPPGKWQDIKARDSVKMKPSKKASESSE